MIGSKQTEFSSMDWVKGMSTSSEISDGGFSPETDGVNLIKTPGVIYAPAQQVDASTNVADNIIASCGGTGSLSAVLTATKYFLGDAKKYYSWNGTTMTLQKTASTGTYIDGRSDMVQFGDNIYATTTNDLTQWNGGSTLDESYWVATKSQSALQSGAGEPHPLLVYENSLWIGDRNVLRSLDSSLAVGTTLTLDSRVIIYALSIDPASGKMLISTSTGVNNSDTEPQIYRILIWDGFSLKPNRSIIVEDLVTAFYPMSGVMYVTYGKNLGVFNGSGIDFLRKLDNVTYNNTSLVYKHRITSINKNLYVADGNKILCFGEVLTKQPKVFYYALKNSTSAQITVLTGIGQDKLGFACSTNKFYTFDTMSSASTNTMTFYTNKVSFPRPVYIRSAYLEYYDAVTNNDNNRNLYYQTQTRNFTILNVINGTALRNSSGSSVYEIENVGGFTSDPVKSLQFRYNTDTTNFGLKRIVVYFDPAE